MSFKDNFLTYSKELYDSLTKAPIDEILELKESLMDAYKHKRNVFICGNGGSAANAMHIANDFIYPVTKQCGKGLKITSLCDNVSSLTCIANDEGYDKIYSIPLEVHAKKDDILIVLSGSGNSLNILNAVNTAKAIGVKTFGIFGMSGGKAKDLCDNVILFKDCHMQISEDVQLIIMHIIMKEMYNELSVR